MQEHISLLLHKQTLPFLNISLYLNDIKPVQALSIENTSESNSAQLVVKITSDIPCIEPFEFIVAFVPAKSRIKIPLDGLKVSRHFLNKLSETEIASISIEIIENDITWVLAHIEAGIDFTSENLEVVDFDIMLNKLDSVSASLKTLISSYSSGKLITEGIEISLIGSPNVGKSSLMNLLLDENRAIVTDIPGTTRDLVTSQFIYNGLIINLVDTAGLRSSDDIVENIGISKTKEQVKKSHFNLFVFDLSAESIFSSLNQLEEVNYSQSLFIFNKMDLNTNIDLKSLYSQFLTKRVMFL